MFLSAQHRLVMVRLLGETLGKPTSGIQSTTVLKGTLGFSGMAKKIVGFTSSCFTELGKCQSLWLPDYPLRKVLRPTARRE